MMRSIVAALILAMALPGYASAKTIEKSGTFAGIRVNYKVVVPDNYDPARAYPVVIAFAGGSQEMRIVDGVLENHWAREAERRGYIIVSPAAPGGQLFSLETLAGEGSKRLFDQLDDAARNCK